MKVILSRRWWRGRTATWRCGGLGAGTWRAAPAAACRTCRHPPAAAWRSSLHSHCHWAVVNTTAIYRWCTPLVVTSTSHRCHRCHCWLGRGTLGTGDVDAVRLLLISCRAEKLRVASAHTGPAAAPPPPATLTHTHTRRGHCIRGQNTSHTGKNAGEKLVKKIQKIIDPM